MRRATLNFDWNISRGQSSNLSAIKHGLSPSLPVGSGKVSCTEQLLQNLKELISWGSSLLCRTRTCSPFLFARYTFRFQIETNQHHNDDLPSSKCSVCLEWNDSTSAEISDVIHPIIHISDWLLNSLSWLAWKQGKPTNRYRAGEVQLCVDCIAFVTSFTVSSDFHVFLACVRAVTKAKASLLTKKKKKKKACGGSFMVRISQWGWWWQPTSTSLTSTHCHICTIQFFLLTVCWTSSEMNCFCSRSKYSLMQRFQPVEDCKA